MHNVEMCPTTLFYQNHEPIQYGGADILRFLLAIDLFSMANSVNPDNPHLIGNFINNPVIPHSDSPAISQPLELPTADGTWIILQCTKGLNHSCQDSAV